jgi:hypothetical protein
MITVLFTIIAAVVCVPILAVVLVVSMASHREESALSLDKPAQGIVQALARRVLDFHTEEPAWPMPRYAVQAKSAAPALRSVAANPVAQPLRSTVADTPRSVVPSKVSIRPAA